MIFSRLDYCQFLMSSQVNYTLTHLTQHPVLNKSFGPQIEMTQKQWSGNTQSCARHWSGLLYLWSTRTAGTSGLLTTVSTTRSKRAEANCNMSPRRSTEMFHNAIQRGLVFKTVLMDSCLCQ